MAETLSPNPKSRAPFSPTKSPFFIGSNDDKLERAQARAARAAAIRRKPTVHTPSPLKSTHVSEKNRFLSCFTTASNSPKINQKNTWELNLIDHLCEIIKVEEENDTETNFQKASCTLEAGVKIYSMRVDSVHSEAYKVLGGINRVGQEDEQGLHFLQLSPLSTLESSFAAINVKKFDVAFVVDPLYHQTSAQFDEGGAKGLLLNNLGVYANCRVLFDSLEVPGKCLSPVSQCEGVETVDLSFASECVEQMVSNMLNKSEISPSLTAIVNKFDKDDRRPLETYSTGLSSEQVNESPDRNVDLDGETFGNAGTWDFDHDDQASVVDEATYDQDTVFPSQQEADEQLNFHDPDLDDRVEEVDSYLFLSLGFSTKQNAWAGPSHWKYRKVKGQNPEVPDKENGPLKPKKTKNKKADIDIDFSNAIDTDISHIFAPPKNPKSLLLPANRAPCDTKLPEDCHYQPEDLVKLFLLPHVLSLGKSGRKRIDEESQQRDGYGATTSWDDEDAFGGAFDDGHAYSDNEETNTLVSQPRQVSKIEVQYDKTSKQVDVHVLKEILWGQIQQINQTSVEEPSQVEAPEETISFKQVLASFPDSCRAAASLNDISPHLCFICLLHLANEHGLRILGCPSLDDLSIHLKPHNNPT
ncbi:Condensin complex subunit [Sesamum angolense]|uniref:Condensin complex subunit 2 n=1 Tax=Sesamum angolense TaxID=2727404 RepID=A0AAE1WR44_9LAMI|nr:Condensin complex subunit [Sesamum angolense]